MDLNKLFFEKENYSLLTKCSLKYDPGHFSFKPRLIFTDCDNIMNPKALDFDTEEYLADLFSINSHNTMFEGNYDITNASYTSHKDLCFRKCNNYYIDIHMVLRSIVRKHLTEKAALDLKNTRIIEALCSFMIACTHYDSLIPHLKWLCSSFINLPYKDAVDMNPLRNAIETGVVPNNLILEHNVNTLPVVPYSKVNIQINDLVISATSVVKQVFHNCLVFLIEIFNRIESIPDSSLRDILYGIMTTPSASNETALLNHIYTKSSNGVDIVPEVKKIVEIKDMEQRYYAIRDYAISLEKEVENAADVYKVKEDGMPEGMCELLKFCINESVMNIRIRQIFIMYNYAKEHGMLKNLSTSGQAWISGLGDLTSENTSSMLNRNFFDNNIPDVEKNITENNEQNKTSSGIFYDELDKLATSFSDGGYVFKLDTKYSTSETTNKDKYDTLCKNMGMLTTELIRTLKEIKVYNTGGKNPGKSHGKLDRKNLYKYKTSKDIFFENTYKVKESDLAIGILLDASGSMSGRGISDGINTMIVLTEVLKALNINHSIVSHNSTGWHKCDLVRYQAFREDKTYKCNKNYNIVNIKTGRCNCDSGALHYMEKSLLRTNNKDKICIIFSDGQPTECGETELKEQIRHMEKNNIKVIGVGIGFPAISEYYKDNANGNNMKEMFDIVSKILKQYILEKVDKE